MVMAMRRRQRSYRLWDVGASRTRHSMGNGARGFLSTLRFGYSTKHAAAIAGFARSTAYRRREEDPELAEAWDMAVQEGTDRLEDEARRRAVGGRDEPVFYRSEVAGHVRKYSDTTLALLPNGRRPEKCKCHAEIATKPAKAVDAEVLKMLTDKELDALIPINQKLLGEEPPPEPEPVRREDRRDQGVC